ncbi:hypothetical protein P3T76_005682 [Phytophthora citrophthora]|uniref:Uncharacterized protein n=1 Tax=Phytophthora citrophthora TaxID=4793 RepID=A0AAD9GQW6_9STRA|nr:hypothetical protein P3T76_005682 [Phytophthora citrophthora]
MQRLVLEREVLREESVSLRQKVAKYERFLRIIQSASRQVAPAPENDSNPTGPKGTNATVRCIEAKWQSVQEEAGHRVYFDGRPSFFFHPFSSREFDDVLCRHAMHSSIDSSLLMFKGKYLGWGIYTGRNIQGKQYLIDHVRCSKTLGRSMDSILNGMKRDDGSSKWPIIPTARDVGVKAEISTQTVQYFDENKYVIVLDYSGDVKIRYLCLVQRSKSQQIDGKHVVKFYFVLGDSEANVRGRDAELPAENEVHWITDEAGYSLTLREVDNDEVEVSFDSFACVKSEEEARSHFIKFGIVVTRWEQLVLSSNLLKC